MENGKGNHVSVNMELEMKTIPSNNENQFNELRDLIMKPKCELDRETIRYQDHLNKIWCLLNDSGAAIFETSIKGRNIFHFLATTPNRNPDLLKLFTGYFDGSDALASGSGHLSQGQAEKLLYAQYGQNKMTPIHLAVKNGFTEFLRQILRTFPSLLSAQDGFLNTPLHLSAELSMPESFECMKIILDVISKNDLCEEILIRTGNIRGQTPVHILCSKVPKNQSAHVVEKLNLLLSFECTQDILNLFDNSKKKPLHILCCRDDQFKDPDSNPNLREVLKILILSRKGANNSTEDEHQRTALHLLAISECPSLVDILLKNSKDLDLTRKDAHGRLAIHYATERADRPNSEEIAKKLGDWSTFSEIMKDKILLESQDSFRNYLLWDTYTDDNGGTNSALTSACQAPSQETVEFFLRNVYQAKRNFGIWFRGKDSSKEIFSLKQVYENTPAALKFLFDKSIQIDMDKSTKSCVEFVSDISVITALDKPIHDDKIFSEVEYLSYAEDWPEDLQNTILLHLLTQSALYVMWQQMLPYRILWTIMNVLWLASYFVLIPLNSFPEEEGFPTVHIAAAWVLAVLSSLSLAHYLYEILTVVKMRSTSQLPKSRVLNWLQIILAGILVSGIFLEKENVLHSTLYSSCAAAGVSLSFLLFTLNLGVISLHAGLQIEYFEQTLKKIFKALVYIFPAVIGFLLAFQQLLPKYFSGHFPWAFIKMVVMMTGEYEFGEMYEEYKKGAEESNGNVSEAKNSEELIEESRQMPQLKGGIDLTSFIFFSIFLIFLFTIAISFYNLVTAVSVEKIQSMKRKLQINQIICRLRLINYVQRTMVCSLDYITSWLPCLRVVLPSYISFRSSNTGVTLEQQLRFYIQRDTGSKVMKTKKATCSISPDARCGNGLPKNIKEKIFDMYRKQL